MALKITLFGYPRFELDGRTLEINRRKTAALLAYLALTGQPHSREALAALLWPEQDPAGARANLRRDLSRLNVLSAGGRLQAGRDRVRLDLQDGDQVDGLAFRRQLGLPAGHGHAGEALCPDCQASLAGAAGL